MIAQGKAAEAVALGNTPFHPIGFFPSGLARRQSAKLEGKKRNHLGSTIQGGARSSLALGYDRSVLRRLEFRPLYSPDVCVPEGGLTPASHAAQRFDHWSCERP